MSEDPARGEGSSPAWAGEVARQLIRRTRQIPSVGHIIAIQSLSSVRHGFARWKATTASKALVGAGTASWSLW